jgi:hypothetical protein
MRIVTTAPIVISLLIFGTVDALAGSAGKMGAPYRPSAHYGTSHRSGWTQPQWPGSYHNYPMHIGANPAPAHEPHTSVYDHARTYDRQPMRDDHRYDRNEYTRLHYRTGPIRYSARHDYGGAALYYSEPTRIPYRYVLNKPRYAQHYYARAPRFYEYAPGLGADPDYPQYPLQPSCTCPNY